MAEKNEKSVWIDIDDIKIDEMQSRLGHWSNDKKDDALVDSMKGIGQIQDVIVRPLSSKNGEKFKYGLVAGSRRFNAIVKAGKSKIRAIVKEMDDVEALETSISENIGRKDLTPFEETMSVFRLHELLMSKEEMGNFEAQKKIAKILFGDEGRAKSSVNAILSRIRNLPPSVLTLLKKPEERTREEKEILKKYSIPLDFEGISGGLSNVLSSLAISLNGITDEDKADKIFSAFSQLDLYSPYKTEDQIRSTIIELRDSIKKGNPFEVALHNAKEEKKLLEIRQAFSFTIGTFSLPSKQYWDWHGKAVSRSRMDPDDLVHKVYVDWLEKQAKKEGW